MSEEKIAGKNRILLTLGLVVLIFITGAGITFYFISNKPEAKGRPPKPREQPVEVVEIAPATKNMQIHGMGTVIASRAVDLMARVSGQIEDIHPQFTPGGRMQAGDVAVILDDTDAVLTLRSAESALTTAKASLEIEKGQQKVAKAQLTLLKKRLQVQDNEDLALRKPQLNQALATLQDAQAKRDKAKLDLERTKVKVPFNALITERHVNPGSYISATTSLATLVGADSYWVEMALPVESLSYLTFGSKKKKGSSAFITGRSQKRPRKGYVLQKTGGLLPQSRMAKVIVEVPDPLSSPSLLLDEYVSVVIEGPERKNVYALPHSLIREGGSAWIFKDKVLEIRPLTIAWQDKDYAYVTAGLNPGEQIVSSYIASPVPGMALRLTSYKASAQQNSPEE